MNILHFVHSPADGYLGCFQFGVIVNKAIMNILAIKLFLWPGAFIGYLRSSGIVRSSMKCSYQNMFNLSLIRPIGTTSSLQETWEMEE